MLAEIMQFNTGFEMPWEKQEIESARAFSAFKTYRDLPPHERSLVKAVKVLYGDSLTSPDAKLRQFQTWSSRFGWVARSQAWDVEKDRVERQAFLDNIKAIRERRVRIGNALEGLAVARLKNIKPEDLKDIEEVIMVIKSALSIQDASLGLDGEDISIFEHEETTNSDNLSELSTEKLRALIIHRRKMLPPGTTPEPTLQEF